MVCQNKGTVQMWVRGAALVAFLLSLATFGHTGAPQAAAAHLVMSTVSAVLAIAVIFPSLKITARAAAGALLPATALSLLCYVGLIASTGFRAQLGATDGLLAAVVGLVILWVLAVGWCLKRGFVTLPRP